jgi:hypothetical protein
VADPSSDEPGRASDRLAWRNRTSEVSIPTSDPWSMTTPRDRKSVTRSVARVAVDRLTLMPVA